MKWNFARGCCALVVLMSSLLSAAGLAEQPVLGTHQVYPCITADDSGVIPVVSNQVCGKIYRQENPLDSASDLIEVHYLKLPATGVANNPPLLFIQGGPGGDAISLAGHMKWTLRQLNVDHDFVFIDLRGTGKSNRLNCDGLEQAPFVMNAKAELEKALDKCLLPLRDKAPFYNTSYSVDDVDALRNALGYTQWKLWSVSYGGRVALDYMARYPEHIAAVVLDSPAPVSVALPSQLADALNRGLKKVADTCKADALCFSAFGDASENTRALTARLEQAPQTFTQKEPLRLKERTYEITAFTFINSLNSFFYSRLTYSQISEAIWRAKENDWSMFIAMSKMVEANTNVSMPLHFLVVCNEDRNLWPATYWNNLFGQDVGHFYKRACRGLPKSQIPDDFYTPLKSDIPTLILSGENDVVTPTVVAESLQKSLTQSQLIKVKNGTHAVSFEGCIPELMTRFLKAPTQQVNTQGCENRIVNKALYKGGLNIQLPEVDAQDD